MSNKSEELAMVLADLNEIDDEMTSAQIFLKSDVNQSILLLLQEAKDEIDRINDASKEKKINRNYYNDGRLHEIDEECSVETDIDLGNQDVSISIDNTFTVCPPSLPSFISKQEVPVRSNVEKHNIKATRREREGEKEREMEMERLPKGLDGEKHTELRTSLIISPSNVLTYVPVIVTTVGLDSLPEPVPEACDRDKGRGIEIESESERMTEAESETGTGAATVASITSTCCVGNDVTPLQELRPLLELSIPDLIRDHGPSNEALYLKNPTSVDSRESDFFPFRSDQQEEATNRRKDPRSYSTSELLSRYPMM